MINQLSIQQKGNEQFSQKENKDTGQVYITGHVELDERFKPVLLVYTEERYEGIGRNHYEAHETENCSIIFTYYYVCHDDEANTIEQVSKTMQVKRVDKVLDVKVFPQC